MKHFFALILVAVLFASCDDGDLTQVSFEFDDKAAGKCGSGSPDFFIYKIQDQRALIIQLPESSFKNEISADKITPTLPLAINGSSIRLIYREYSGEITSNTMCSTIPVSDPVVVNEREATEGTITITTTALKSEPDANGATKITGYLHTLVFKDLVFDLGGGNTQINEAFTQVTYETAATTFTSFAGISPVFSCENDITYLFKYLDKQAIVLDLSDADAAFLFSGEPGPKTRLISSDNKLTRLFFDTTMSTLDNAYFCTTPLPETPPVIDTFTAENGIADQSGIIEVTSLPSDTGFKHTIILKKVRLVKGTLKVEMGNEYIFGVFNTVN